MTLLKTDIRFAEASDSADLARIHENAWVDAYAGILPHHALTRMIARRHEGWWRETISDGSGILVCEFSGQVIGYATLGSNRTQSLGVGGELFELYLEPVYQGLGFGRRLFHSAQRLLASHAMDGMAVWCLAENERACRFFKRLGGYDVAQGEEVFDGRSVLKIAFVWP